MAASPALAIGVSLLLAAGPALGQTPAPKPAPARTAAAAQRTAVPRTLAQALAATYLYQPALQAARALLRATDENVPQALAGWKPTVIVAGTAGYGDGYTRQFLKSSGTFQNLRTNRDVAPRRPR